MSPPFTTSSHARWQILRRLGVALGLALLLSLSMAGCSFGQEKDVSTEIPPYKVLQSFEGTSLEIRQYEPRLIAYTMVEAETREEASSIGFQRLAGFIFGDNVAPQGDSEKIAMTAPVEMKPPSEKIAMTAPVEMRPSEKIAMTAPVEMKPDETSGLWKIVFTMPSKYTMETLPKPTSDLVKIEEEPGSTIAALRFSGTMNPELTEEYRNKLQKLLAEHGYEPLEPIAMAGYNAPYVPGFMRRNEAMVQVKKKE